MSTAIQIVKLLCCLVGYAEWNIFYSLHKTKSKLIKNLKNIACLNFSCEYFLFSSIKHFLGLCRRSEIIKMNAKHDLKQRRWCKEIFLEGYVVWLRNSFAREPKSWSVFQLLLWIPVWVKYKVDLKVWISVGPYSLPWHFIEKISWLYCVFLNSKIRYQSTKMGSFV